MAQLSPKLSAMVCETGRKLTAALTAKADRKHFFSTLSRLLQEHFHFDRLCINLYDQHGGMLTYFTAAEGVLVSTLSPVRPAEASSTVAGHVIATRKPVVITDFAQYFSESSAHPIAEAGLTATMAFPLLLDNEIIATLHCSFARKPDNIYEITSLLIELCPVVAVCLGAILSQEQLSYDKQHLQVQTLQPDLDDAIIWHSARMREVMRKVNAVAALNVPVLILGETGTGKSLIAREIHLRSKRKEGNFVKVNCPALPQTLFESELFGHAKGAFTGASGKRVGRFELAHGGTLFLDEIGELTTEMQSKLLQVLDDSSFERVGESVALVSDVRIVAATNVVLGEALARGALRADLLYRLSVCTLELPPLRERSEDIPPLIAALAAQISKRLGLPALKFGKALMQPLRDYRWPGNVRELRNVLSRLVVRNSMHGQIGINDVEQALRESRELTACGNNEKKSPARGWSAAPPPRAGASRAEQEAPAPGKPRPLAEMEREHIARVLEACDGIVSGPGGAAAALGLARSTLLHRMRRLGLK